MPKQPPGGPPAASYGSSTVDKAVDVLVAVATASNGLTNLEVSNRLKLDRSTTHRLLTTLERRGLVERPSNRRYTAGSHLFYLAFGAKFDIRTVVVPVLADLVALTGESASFSIMRGDRYYCALDYPSPHELRYCPKSGSSYPLNSGATGLVMWAFSPGKRREQLLRDAVLEEVTPRTITDREELREELRRTAERGFGMSAGARTAGGCAIASPVISRQGVVLGAVTLSAAEARLPLEKLVDYEADLAAAARTISESVGWAE